MQLKSEDDKIDDNDVVKQTQLAALFGLSIGALVKSAALEGA